MFAAEFRLGSISRADKRQRVEKLIEQLGLLNSRNTYIGDGGTRGVSGGERRRVSIGVDIIHGPSLLFLDEPTSGLDSTSAHSVIEKVHDIEYFIDVVQEYDQTDLGVEVLAEFAPPQLVAYEEMSASMELPSPSPAHPPKLDSHKQATKGTGGFDHSVRSQMNTLRSWSASQSITYTPTRNHTLSLPIILDRNCSQ